VIVPANELIPWREKQLSGTTSRSGFRTGVRGGVGFSSGGSQRFRHVNLRLCADCADVRIEAARRDRFWANMRGLVTLGVIVAVVVAFINIKPSRPAADNPTNITDTNPAAEEDGNIVKPVTAVDDDPATNTDAGVQAQRMPQDQPGPDDRSAQSDDTPPDGQSSLRASTPPDDVAAAITAATPDALETGQPQRWSVDGKNGYVVPSAAQAYADRSCRNVYSTIIEGGAQKQSQSQQWCWRNDGSGWKLTP
jgi:hypothetical protein